MREGRRPSLISRPDRKTPANTEWLRSDSDLPLHCEAGGRPRTQRNGCTDDSTESNPAEGARLVSYDCPAGAEVEFYILDGGGHTWPGSEFHAASESVLGPTNMNVVATETMWAFFQQHARP